MDTKYLLDLRVKEVMNANLITVAPDTILKEVKIIMERENIHHVLVVDNTGVLEGIVSKSDILLLMDWGTRMNLPQSMRKNNFLLTSNLVKDIMTKQCIIISPEDNLKKCVDLFEHNFFHALPVIDSNMKLVGLITTYDLITLAYTEQAVIA